MIAIDDEKAYEMTHNPVPDDELGEITDESEIYDDNAQWDATPLIEQYERWRRKGALLVIWGFLIGATLMIISLILFPSYTPLTTEQLNKLGIHLLLDDGRNQWDRSVWDEHFSYAEQIVGVGSPIVQVIRADDLNVEHWQIWLDWVAEIDATPVIRLATTFDTANNWWHAPPADSNGTYQGFANDFSVFLADLDFSNAPIILLHNEPNSGIEWGGVPSASEYIQYMRDMIPAIRQAVPEAKIANGALDLYAPTTGDNAINGVQYVDAHTFLTELLSDAPELIEQLDLWNSHPYPMGAFIAPPWEQIYQFNDISDSPNTYPDIPNNIVNQGINGYLWELWMLSEFDIEEKPVLISEFGWRYGSEPYPDADTVATYLDMALRGNQGKYPAQPIRGWFPLLTDERVMGVAIFALNGTHNEWAHTSLLHVNEDGTITDTTPMFDVLQALHSD